MEMNDLKYFHAFVLWFTAWLYYLKDCTRAVLSIYLCLWLLRFDMRWDRLSVMVKWLRFLGYWFPGWPSCLVGQLVRGLSRPLVEQPCMPLPLATLLLELSMLFGCLVESNTATCGSTKGPLSLGHAWVYIYPWIPVR